MGDVAKIEQGDVQTHADIAPMVAMIERIVMDPSIPIDRLEQMLAMKERMEAKEAAKAFAAAFAKMQASLPVIKERGEIKDKNGRVQSTYPLWEDVIAALRKPLTDNGLSMSFDRRKDDGKTFIGCIVTHEAGHSRRAEIDLPRDTSGNKNEVQGEGSTVSYGQRYSSKLLINWISEGSEDDDGRAAGSSGTISEQQFNLIRKLLDQVGGEDAFLKLFGVDMIDLIPASRFFEAEAILRRKANAATKGAPE